MMLFELFSNELAREKSPTNFAETRVFVGSAPAGTEIEISVFP